MSLRIPWPDADSDSAKELLHVEQSLDALCKKAE